MLIKKTLPLTLLHILAALLVIPSLAWSAQAIEAPLALNLSSRTIQISTFYNGTTLEVTGTVPVDNDIVLQVSGPKQDVHLKVKGKIAGFLWMNKDDASLENIPAVYMVYTPPGTIGNFISSDLGIGYKALLKDISISPESSDKAFVFGEYVKLMEDSGVYAINEAAITYGEPNNGTKGFSATLSIPSKMAAGKYTVEAIALKDRRIQGQTQDDLTLELTGLPAVISSMAFDNPLLYGFMAVFIALGAGLAIGVIFRGGGGAH